MKKINVVRKENLEKLITDFIEKGGKSRAKFAERIYMSPGQLGQLVGTNAKKNIGNNLARKIEANLNLPDGFLDQNQEAVQQAVLTSHIKEISFFDENEMVKIPLIQENDKMEIEMDFCKKNNDYLSFNSKFFEEKNIDLSNVAYAKVIGNSMAPVLPNNSIVLVDIGKATIIDGYLYLIKVDDLFRVRLLYLLPHKKIKTKAYNNIEYSDEIFNKDEIKIIGKVIWYSSFIS